MRSAAQDRRRQDRGHHRQDARGEAFEAVTMGIKSGFSIETCARVLAKGSARNYTTEITLPKFVKGELKTNFTLGLMLKDVRLATELGLANASSCRSPTWCARSSRSR